MACFSRDCEKLVTKSQKKFDQVIGYQDLLPDYDFYIPMLSIPKVLEWQPTMDTQKFPYLQIEDKPLDFISKNKINIGLRTQTRKERHDEKPRSIEIGKFNGIFDKQKHKSYLPRFYR